MIGPNAAASSMVPASRSRAEPLYQIIERFGMPCTKEELVSGFRPELANNRSDITRADHADFHMSYFLLLHGLHVKSLFRSAYPY